MSKFFDAHEKSKQYRKLILETNSQELHEEHVSLFEEWESEYAPFRNEVVAHLDEGIEQLNKKHMPSLSVPDVSMLMGEQFKLFCKRIEKLHERTSHKIKGGETVGWEHYVQALDEFEFIKNILNSELERNKRNSSFIE